MAVFEDPPPIGRTVKEPEWAQVLRSSPKRWARVLSDANKSVANFWQNQWNHSYPIWMDGERWESTQRRNENGTQDVYVRYMGRR